MAFPEDVFNELEREAILNYFRPKPSFGKYYEFWSQHAPEIAAFIKEESLKPVQPEAVGAAEARGNNISPIPRQLYGGMRNPHLHFHGQIFPLTNGDWGKFSQRVLVKVTEKLQAASQVSFQDMLEINEATSRL